MQYKGYIIAGALALLWTLESLFPHFEHFVQNRGSRLRHGARNLGIGIINGVAVGIVLALLTKWSTEWAAARNLGLFHQFNGSMWVEGVGAIVLLDLWMYWWHRMNHEVSFFWRFHRMHHSDPVLDATSALRFHPGEVLLSGILRVGIILLLGLHLWQVALYELVLFPIIVTHHSNFEIPRRLDAALRWIIVTPWVHWVHHSRIQTETDSNYGTVFTFWDRLFGSFRLRAEPREIVYGLHGWDEGARQSLVGMLKTPLVTETTKTGLQGLHEPAAAANGTRSVVLKRGGE